MEQKDYFIRNSKQIISKLTEVLNNRISLFVSIDNQEHFITAILEIDAKKQIIKFDCSRNEATNRQLLSASKVLFRTEVNGIKASFKGYNIKRQSGDKSVFEMSVPESIYWLQRREYYRIKVPYEHFSYLELVLKSFGKNAGMETFTKKLKLNDLSVEGFSFYVVDSDIQRHYESNMEKMVGMIIQGKLLIPENDDDQSDVEFEIKSVEKMKNGPAGHYRVGCGFKQITQSFQANIQRYMQGIELEARAKAEGLL